MLWRVALAATKRRRFGALMVPRNKRILRITFAVVGTVAALLGVVTLGGSLVVRFVLHAGDAAASVAGVAYVCVAVVSFVVVRRTKAPAVGGSGSSAGT